VRDAWERCALPFALQAAGELVFHASAVLVEGGAVALAGRSGAGKSTLRDALVDLGYEAYADDAVAVAAGEPPVVAFLPFLPKRGPDRAGVRIAEPPRGIDRAPLLAVVVVKQRPGGPSLRRLRPAEAFEELLANTYSLPDRSGRFDRPGIDRVLEVAAAVPVFELGYEASGRSEPDVVGALASVARGAPLAMAAGPSGSADTGGVLRAARWLVGHTRSIGRAVKNHPSARGVQAAKIWFRYLALRALRNRLGPDRQAKLALRHGGNRSAPDSQRALGALASAAAVFPSGAAEGCLERSLVVARALAGAGYEPEVVVGWSEQRGDGHAWVELEGMPVLDDSALELELTELWRLDSRGERLDATS
jgi:hypothetical protein